MENDIEMMIRVLSILKNKYKLTDNLMVFTKELEKAAEINDMESIGAVLSMRREAMEKIDNLNSEISRELVGMEKPCKDKIKRILESKAEPDELESQLEMEISDTNRMILSLLEKIVVLDKEINKRINKEAASA